jgi:hypothetical protein
MRNTPNEHYQKKSRIPGFIAIGACAIAVFGAITNGALQGAILFRLKTSIAPDAIYAFDARNNPIAFKKNSSRSSLYFSYDSYGSKKGELFSPEDIALFFIPHEKAFAAYNNEGRRFGLLIATDSQTNKEYSCWISRPPEYPFQRIGEDCEIPESASLRSIKLILMRPTSIIEKIAFLKKQLYG